MQKYKNLSGKSGVVAFESGQDYIRIKFQNSPDVYTYSYNSAGIVHVEQMKIFAVNGFGLSTYISKNVKDKYE